ncbi:hypothetical protein KC323_g306 [Hortaea werneckii]|nr:hypothetical protein KC323_g306 [Hortaea werneckii]
MKTFCPDRECGTRSLPGGRRSFAVPSGMDHIMDIIRSTAQIDSQSSALCHRSRSIATKFSEGDDTPDDDVHLLDFGTSKLSGIETSVRKERKAEPIYWGYSQSKPKKSNFNASQRLNKRIVCYDESLLCCDGYGQEGLLLPESVEASHRLASDAILTISSREDEGLSFSCIKCGGGLVAFELLRISTSLAVLIAECVHVASIE